MNEIEREIYVFTPSAQTVISVSDDIISDEYIRKDEIRELLK